MQFVLLADNNNPVQNDKWKIRPLMDKLEHALLKYFVPEENINYDESMVKYFERYGLEQFIRGKPIRVGYKMWSLNISGGYLFNFDLYQNKNPLCVYSDEQLYGKANGPLVGMLRELLESKKKLPYKLSICRQLIRKPNSAP
ncbi:Transposase IS4 [Popillia japonica]|uniref:Transposase IS4 n=1 Tax=Popillia japonica TaxID=7064 RepID=A0AAW1ITX2_POPJA